MDFVQKLLSAYILVKINTSGFLNRQADLAVFPNQGDVSACLTAVEGHDITSTQLFDYCITTLVCLINEQGLINAQGGIYHKN